METVTAYLDCEGGLHRSKRSAAIKTLHHELYEIVRPHLVHDVLSSNRIDININSGAGLALNLIVSDLDLLAKLVNKAIRDGGE